jgi:flavin-dependent dehydrogenase
VDASGRAGFLAKQFGQRVADPILRNIALYRQYEDVPRADGRRAGDIRIVSRDDGGWFWFIPIGPDLTSVGIVMPREAHQRAARTTATATLDGLVSSTPVAATLLGTARPVGEARYEADYSYLHSLQAGPRFVLVGDAGAFLDPIFSTGVLLALQSGHEAGVAVAEGLAAGDLGAARFRAFERRVRRRYHHFRRFAVGFYDPAFRDLFMSPTARFGLFAAVLSILAGNWRPSLGTRLRIHLFFVLVAVQRVLPLAPRHRRPKVIDHVQ